MFIKEINYPKLYWKQNYHYERYKNHVLSMSHKLICQECRGFGGYTEPVLDYGQGPFITCGYCEGTGYLTPYRRALWLKYKKLEKQNNLKAY